MKRSTTIAKWQHGIKYEFHYESTKEAAKCLRVAPPTLWTAKYKQHKCRTFEVNFETKKNFYLTKFV